MEKCLTQAERWEKKRAIRYLRGELKERLDYLDGEPDNLCQAYQAIIESMKNQIGAKDVIEETHDVLRAEQISFKALLRIFNFFLNWHRMKETWLSKLLKMANSMGNSVTMDGID